MGVYGFKSFSEIAYMLTVLEVNPIFATNRKHNTSTYIEIIKWWSCTAVLFAFTGQLDASESLFTYPEGLTAADFAVLDHDPPYLDEVVASASAEVLQACGNNVECIFDSMETGDINIGLETMAMISIIDEDERLACTLFVSFH